MSCKFQEAIYEGIFHIIRACSGFKFICPYSYIFIAVLWGYNILLLHMFVPVMKSEDKRV
jgi:hypothetical protein